MVYIIEWGWTEQELMVNVNEKISEGWIPQGGVAICVHDQLEETGYYQAMIRNK